MTNQTLLLALLIGSALAVVLGLIGRRFKRPSIAAAVAFALPAVLALPVMLGYWQDIQRLIAPRESVEWIPLGLLALAIPTSMSQVDAKRQNLWIGFGIVLAVLLACRLMYGSIYLRELSVSKTSLAIIGWGLAVGACWAAQLVPEDSQRKLDVALQLVGLAAVSANLGMSGSFIYGAVGVLFLALAISAWLAARAAVPLVLASGLLLLGLGPTFAETQWVVVMLLGVMMLGYAVLPRLISNRVRLSVALAATLCLTIGTSLTIVKLRQDISGSSKEATGYEAYR